MAGHMLVLYSEKFIGGAIVNSMPFWSSQAKFENIGRAYANPDTVDIDTSAFRAVELAKTGDIADLENLFNKRIYVFGGEFDPVVKPPLAAKTGVLLRDHFHADVRIENAIGCEHTMPTVMPGAN